MKFPESLRTAHPMGFAQPKGSDFGWFELRIGRVKLAMQAVAANDECPWDHVSVSAWDMVKFKPLMPTWEQMCVVKDLFWDETQEAVQFHPPKSDYVNFAKNCLHLWRPAEGVKLPPTWAVGPK